eukprot:4356755-Pleurochrysis_carterae.AAC.1
MLWHSTTEAETVNTSFDSNRPFRPHRQCDTCSECAVRVLLVCIRAAFSKMFAVTLRAQMTDRFWWGYTLGAYVGHAETILCGLHPASCMHAK